MEVIEKRHRTDAFPKPGDHVVFSSTYTGFATDAFNDQFTLLTKHDLRQMLPGHTLYFSLSGLYPLGRVHGWVKVIIEKIQLYGNSGSAEIIVTFKGGGVSGSRTIKHSLRNEFAQAVNEHALAGIIESLPLSKSPYPPRA